MKAIPVIYEGIQFRSKLEARWYIFMKKLGWSIDYEPEVPDVIGYLPDFIIYPDKARNCVFCKDMNNANYTPIYVEVKPLNYLEEFFESKKYEEDVKKITRSGMLKHDLIVVGSVLFNKSRGNQNFAIRFKKEPDSENQRTFMFSYTSDTPPEIGAWYDCMEYIRAEGDPRGYLFDWRLDNEPSNPPSSTERAEKFIETSWNKAWTELRWKGKEVK
jgi:hypothetical protein